MESVETVPIISCLPQYSINSSEVYYLFIMKMEPIMESTMEKGLSDTEEFSMSDIFELSKTTTVEWIVGGQLLICRRKRRYDGTLSPFPYEVYVNPETCLSILSKQAQIQTTMLCVQSEQLANPTNVELGGGKIIQCSVFNRVPKYGIHIMENNRIARRKGLNLSKDEFTQMLNFLCYAPPTIPKPLDPSITLTQYAYEWTPRNPLTHSSISDESWYILPDTCFKEAEKDKPISEDYTLTISTREVMQPINQDLVDAAVARIICHLIDMEKSVEAMRNNRLLDYYDEAGNDLLTYAPRVRQSITSHQIFTFLLKILKKGENSQAQIKALMDIVMKRGNHPDVLEFMKKGELNQDCVDILMDINI